jgi:peptide-methionine (R)-S-oxide reductase
MRFLVGVKVQTNLCFLGAFICRSLTPFNMKTIIFCLSFFWLVACDAQPQKGGDQSSKVPSSVGKIDSSDAYWRKTLSPEAYAILRQRATERPHTGAYDQLWDKGVYQCLGCGLPLFYSNTKFDAGCGWPSFFQAIDSSRIRYLNDFELGYPRTEIRCARCDGHLGHVFNDGPPPTGLRFCLNSGALKFIPKHKDE